MSNNSYLADEHVSTSFISALRAEGFNITFAQDEFGQETDDEDDLLNYGLSNNAIILTHDRDFKEKHELGRQHNGIIIYFDESFINTEMGKAIAAMKHFDETMVGGASNQLHPLKQWVPDDYDG